MESVSRNALTAKVESCIKHRERMTFRLLVLFGFLDEIGQLIRKQPAYGGRALGGNNPKFPQ
ncbi:hypothetical protein NB231_01938 [Nitrococcus mobilis Nb-231]|uniref:Uncharacterized protein n=1 Tax=Nitrococcus mobilis Nb-231 TaxID=314278 RepID=A4BUC4_9GAMM|nr:hypothetical protein NB231_01938 [Nitrococcus mobilis Nb-231]